MCGIAGLMTADGAPPDARRLAALRAALRHRGPDGEGEDVAGGTALVHTRLSIIDLETGDQPLYLADRTALIGNGEIYNYRELRAAIGEDAFSTRSDCEPPLHLYARHGIAFAEHLRGMYALAIHDRRNGRLVLTRDPFGIKPLYYVEFAGGFAFASELQALIAAGLAPRRLNAGARDELLQLQFTTGRETAFEGLYRVLPGETLVVSAGRIVDRARRAALPGGRPRAWDEDEALVALEKELLESVDLHQRSDVPYGMFLSGGVDSSALLAAMARLNSRPVLAFTAGFDVAEAADERGHARTVARAAGAEHVEIEFTEHDFWQQLPAVAAALDDPTADYAVLPTFKLAEAAAARVKVVLSGEGGDELFAGYGRYRSAIRPWWRGGRRQVRGRGRFDRLGVLRAESLAWRDGIVAAESLQAAGGLNRLQGVQAIDCQDWLPNDLLIKLDRCLMAHGVEGRTPFLDPALADFAFRLPDELKIRRNLGKYLLRRWLERALPEARPFARKRGFTVPVGAWIASRGRDLGPLVARQPGIAEIAFPERVVDLFRRGGKREGLAAWTLLFYALWHQRHILDRPAGGDVFAALEAT